MKIKPKPIFANGQVILSSLSNEENVRNCQNGYENYNFNDDTVLQLRLNDSSGATAVDSSGNGNNGTVSGTTHWGFDGIAGSDCFNFTETDENYITVSSITFDDSETQSYSFWVNISTPPVEYYVLLGHSPSSYADGWVIYSLTGADLILYTATAGDIIVVETTMNQWHHVSLNMSGDGSAILYIDGVRIENEAAVGDMETTSSSLSLTIGGLPGDSSSFSNAKIDNVCIFGKLLSQEEILGIYNKGTGTEELNWCGCIGDEIDLTEGLVAYYKMNETSGTVTYDDSDNSLNGTTVNNASVYTSETTRGLRRCHHINDISNNATEVPNNSLLRFGTSPFSISAWATFNNAAALNIIVAKYDGTQTEFKLNSSGDDIFFALYTNTSNYKLIRTSSDFLEDNVWYHIVVIHNGSIFPDSTTTTIYVNGTKQTLYFSDSGTYSGMPSSSAVLSIGAEGSGANVADGYISNVALWDRELSSQEKDILYNNGFGIEELEDCCSSGKIYLIQDSITDNTYCTEDIGVITSTEQVIDIFYHSDQCDTALCDIIPVNGQGRDIYYVSNQTDLQNVSNDLNGHYIQTQNITCTGSFTPIGTLSSPFFGCYDGQGFNITNLTVSGDPSSDDYQGLFGYIENDATALPQVAKLRNINLINCDITGRDYVGGVVGKVGTTVTDEMQYIINCHVEGDVSGVNYVGGLSGFLLNLREARDCSTNVAVTNQVSSDTTPYYYGGFIGYAVASEISYITNCVSYGSVTITNKRPGFTSSSFRYFGGFIGFAASYNMSDCESYTTISLNPGGDTTSIGNLNDVGGMFGAVYTSSYNYSYIIEKCSSHGTITIDSDYTGSTSTITLAAAGFAGSVVGYSGTSAVLQDCFTDSDIDLTGRFNDVSGFCTEIGATSYPFVCRRCYNANTISYTYAGTQLQADTTTSAYPSFIYDNYYDSTINTLPVVYFTPLSTADAKKESSYANWDMSQLIHLDESVWKIVEDETYPYHVYYDTCFYTDPSGGFFEPSM